MRPVNGKAMTPEERVRMNALCLQIQQEKNYDTFEELSRQLRELVTRKEQRFPERRFYTRNSYREFLCQCERHSSDDKACSQTGRET